MCQTPLVSSLLPKSCPFLSFPRLFRFHRKYIILLDSIFCFPSLVWFRWKSSDVWRGQYSCQARARRYLNRKKYKTKRCCKVGEILERTTTASICVRTTHDTEEKKKRSRGILSWEHRQWSICLFIVNNAIVRLVA